MINILTSNDDLVININTSNHIQHASTNVYTLTGVESSIHDMWRYEYLYYILFIKLNMTQSKAFSKEIIYTIQNICTFYWLFQIHILPI